MKMQWQPMRACQLKGRGTGLRCPPLIECVYQPSMLLSWSKKTCAKSLHVLIISVLGIAFTIAMPSIIITSICTLARCQLSLLSYFLLSLDQVYSLLLTRYIYLPFSLLEAILVDVYMAGVCMASCSLLRDCAKKKNAKNPRILWKWVGG